MIALVEQNQLEIAALCERYGVKSLELFGSAARGDFDPGMSDIDFFVEFLDYDRPQIADDWFGLMESLEKLLGRPIDLISTRMTTNPYFLEVANRHRVTMYAA